MEFENLISIIVPIYNMKDYLEVCIENLVKQTYKNIEIILIDDGSTDGSGEICDNWGKKDNRIVVKHIKNCGCAEARNVALKIAKGNYIGFVDADDYFKEDMYEKLLFDLKKNNSDISACSYYKVFDIEAIPCQCIKKNNDYLNNLFETNGIAGFLWNKLYKKNIIKDIYFVKDLKVKEDLLWNMYIALEKKIEFSCVEEPLYYYVQPNEKIQKEKNIKYMQNTLFADFEIIELLKKYNNDMYKMLEANYVIQLEYLKFLNILNETSRKEFEIKLKKYKEDFLKEKGLYKEKFKYFLVKYFPKIYCYVRNKK